MKKVISIILVCILCIFICPSESKADTIFTVKIPIDATITVKGANIAESNLFTTELASGRINDIAVQKTGITYGYKYYVISNFTSMDDLVVLDRNLIPLLPENISIENRLIEYASSSNEFLQLNSERIRGAAIAYHNRTGGYGTANFYNYILRGSNAAVKCELSDSGRYWGQFVTAPIIEKVEILSVIPYGENAYTAKARIVANNRGGYVEDYTISFLFEKFGNLFYATEFTFMK